MNICALFVIIDLQLQKITLRLIKHIENVHREVVLDERYPFILNQYLSLHQDGWSNTSMLLFLGIDVSFTVNTDTKGEQ